MSSSVIAECVLPCPGTAPPGPSWASAPATPSGCCPAAPWPVASVRSGQCLCSNSLLYVCIKGSVTFKIILLMKIQDTVSITFLIIIWFDLKCTMQV